jgi:hypothetical protein
MNVQSMQHDLGTVSRHIVNVQRTLDDVFATIEEVLERGEIPDASRMDLETVLSKILNL